VPTKRVIRERHRKAAPVNDPATIKLFAELERTPLDRRDSEPYKAKEDDLAWRLGLHAEHRFNAQRVNDQTLLDCPPEYDCFLEDWRRVTAMRKTLLELPGYRPMRRCSGAEFAARSTPALRLSGHGDVQPATKSITFAAASWRACPRRWRRADGPANRSRSSRRCDPATCRSAPTSYRAPALHAIAADADPGRG
jgi:hypothetical protein